MATVSKSANPLRNIVRQIHGGPSASMSTASLVVNGVYHVDTYVRPIVNSQDNQVPPPGFGVGQVQDSLRLPNARVPNREGWKSVAAVGGA